MWLAYFYFHQYIVVKSKTKKIFGQYAQVIFL